MYQTTTVATFLQTCRPTTTTKKIGPEVFGNLITRSIGLCQHPRPLPVQQVPGVGSIHCVSAVWGDVCNSVCFVVQIIEEAVTLAEQGMASSGQLFRCTAKDEIIEYSSSNTAKGGGGIYSTVVVHWTAG